MKIYDWSKYSRRYFIINKTNSPRLQLDLNKIREKELANYLLKYPLKIYLIFERHLNEMVKEIKGEKINP